MNEPLAIEPPATAGANLAVPRTRRWIVWTLAALVGVILAVTLWLMTLNGTLSRDPLTAVFIVVIASYLGVSAVLCSRLPENPIGWLLLVVGGGILVSGTFSEYATYTLRTNPGALPLGMAAAWIQNFGFISVAAVPLILLLFPTGRVPTPRWRWVARATVVDAVLLATASALHPGALDVARGVQPANPLGIEALRGAIAVVNWVGGIALAGLSIASVAAVFVRYRRSAGEERQQLRWLVAVAAICAATLVLVLVSSIGLAPNGSSLFNDVAFVLFLLANGIGIPLAIAVALLRYRLYDLDVVIKKAVVATILVLFLAAASVALLVIASRIVVGPLERSPEATLLAGVVVGVLAWPVLRLSRRVADRVVYGGRATPYEVLTEFSGRMADAYATDDVLPRMAAIVGAGAGARGVEIWLRVGRELRLAGAWPSDAVADGRTVRSLGELGTGAFEVRHQGEALGAITVEMPANDPMNPGKERLIRDLAAQAGLVLRNVRLIEELRASRRRLVSAQDHERRRLERNIHDGAQQQLVALSVKIRLAENLVERDPARATAMLEQIQTDTTDALENLRDLARGIYPPLLADEGLVAALEAQARKAPIPVEVSATGVRRYHQDVEAAVYFCCLEALQNVAKYADASLARIALEEREGVLAFSVRDDGRGFDPETVTRGIGLQGMADRLDAIGGTLALSSTPGGGTTIAGSVPVQVTDGRDLESQRSDAATVAG